MMKKTVLNWSDLDSDLLSEIIDRISCLRDFIIFGAVCKSWRSVASPEKFNKSTKVPWLLLDQKEDDNCHRKFFDLSKEAVYSVNLPKPLYKIQSSITGIRKFCLSYIFKREKCFLCSKGWCLIVEYKTQLSLLNPFSLSRIDLPHPFYLSKDFINNYNFILNFALSSSSSSSSDFTTMILYHLSGAVSPRLAFWKNGDRNWTDIDLIFPSDLIEMTYQNGRYYAAHLNDGPNGYVIHEIDIQNSAFVSTRTKSFSNLSMDTFNPYPFWIVGSSRGLFMVTSELRFNLEIRGGSHPIGLLDIDSYILQFIVEEVDFERGESKEVKDFGDEALFVGLESSFFADVSKESKLKSNHIYFAEKFQELWSYTRRGAGVYSMMDRSYKRLFTEADYGYGSSQWFEPRL
ncbi:uncharacterized protein LOC126662163 isoform X1 [Mercurialis annua]|uniref:uncharacterized protein LOC126662163 isoform X1 n=1 Tax=Mercurialis annua TaxID=3986 RepID=UPI00215EB89C|nr:uncharacterized protein LOC126662163 isoform X1 [Mercurialis annua]